MADERLSQLQRQGTGPQITSNAITEKVVSSSILDHGYETRRGGEEDDEDKFNKSKLIIQTQESDNKS